VTLAAAAVGGGVAARIADIRARFEPAVRTAAAATSATDGFATALAEALGAGASTAGTGATGTTPPGGTTATGERLVELAQEYLGVPYRYGGTDPATGLDCSGFLQHLFQRVGVELPRVSREQARAGTAVASIDQARPGDLVAFGEPVDHIGMYIGEGRFVHAPHSGTSVRIDDLGSRRITAIRRVLPDAVGPTGAAAPTAAGWLAGTGLGALGGSTGVPPAAPGASVLPRDISPQVRRWEAIFVEAGRRYGLDPALLAAQCQKESGGRTDAVSSAGALGLMQFMPATARSRGVDPLDPTSAIHGAASFMAELRDQFGSLDLALAAYNAGPGAVRRAGNTYPSQGVRRYAESVLALAGGPR
jgi:cell wall-associated NlpC family hydrolase